MQKIIAMVLVATCIGVTYGQENTEREKVRKKRFSTGFNIGVNHANLLLPGNTDATVDNGIGYRFGLMSNLALSKRISLEPKAEVSFNTSSFLQDGQEFTINPVNIELVGHMKFNLSRTGLSPYIVAGPNLRLPIGQGQLRMPSRENVAIDLGVGLDMPIGRKVRIAPELRYSFGLMDITQSENVNDIRFHNVSLILNFAGRPRL